MRKLALLLGIAVFAVGMPATADWDPGDGHKMHFPQLPDPFGWDVEFFMHELADDWMCSESGFVTDIHLWNSWAQDQIGVIDKIYVTIWDDDRSDPAYSRPGAPLWSAVFDTFTVRPYGQGDQGFWDPSQGYDPPAWALNDHTLFDQINITDIEDPFYQEEGEIYWLSVYVSYPAGTTQAPTGWKTTLDHFEDGAVYNLPTVGWVPLYDPALFAQGIEEPLDFAFVITPEPTTLMLLGMGVLMLVRRR